MTKVFTSTSKPSLTSSKLKANDVHDMSYEPSLSVIDLILNYSKNLEIRPSNHVAQIAFLKS